LDAELVRKFCLTARLAVVPPNEVILSYGDYVRRMYVIRRGSAEVKYITFMRLKFHKHYMNVLILPPIIRIIVSSANPVPIPIVYVIKAKGLSLHHRLEFYI